MSEGINVGDVFGSLTVISQSSKQKKLRQCECSCICGNTVVVFINNLKNFRTKSCFCAAREKMRSKRIVHSMTGSDEHKIWSGIKKRCLNKNNNAYNNYGGRGITIDVSWLDFQVFYEDMGPRPSSAHSVERVDNDLGYCKSNCIWATQPVQAGNKRNNHLITFNGETHHLAMWAREVGISEDCLERRLNLLKWPIERALTTPARKLGPRKTRPQ
jgi:hypothetical protein